MFLSLGCTLESPEKLSKNINTYTSPLEIVVEDGSQASVFFLSSSGDIHVPRGLRSIVLKGEKKLSFFKGFLCSGYCVLLSDILLTLKIKILLWFGYKYVISRVFPFSVKWGCLLNILFFLWPSIPREEERVQNQHSLKLLWSWRSQTGPSLWLPWTAVRWGHEPNIQLKEGVWYQIHWSPKAVNSPRRNFPPRRFTGTLIRTF